MNCSFNPTRPFVVLYLLVTVVPALSQVKTGDTASPRRFEVVSIKRSRPGATIQDMKIIFPPGRMEAVNITLSELLSSFSGFSGKVEGGPKWVESDRYDVIAKADGEFTSSGRGPMLMALLEDRFKLVIHHESKDEPGIALAKGKQPPDVKPAKDGERVVGRVVRSDDHRQVVFRNTGMPQFASYLRAMLGVPVVDRTGMTGSYDFSLDPDSFASASGEAFRDRVRPAVEALGFKLEPARVARDITIIDHVELPSEN
jgi:uncharacterized protein (TIGR03435 family)